MIRSLIAACVLTVMPLSAAASSSECVALRGKGTGIEKNPPYRDVLTIFLCAGMAEDVRNLDAADHDILVMRAKTLSLDELRAKQTSDEDAKPYFQITSSARLAKFKAIVDAYFKKP